MLRRILWTVLPLASLGILTWVPFLYLLIRTKTWRHSIMLMVTFGISTSVMVLVQIDLQPDTFARELARAYLMANLIIAAVMSWTEFDPRRFSPKPRPAPNVQPVAWHQAPTAPGSYPHR